MEFSIKYAPWYEYKVEHDTLRTEWNDQIKKKELSEKRKPTNT